MSAKKISSTKDYRLFHRSSDNRPLDPKKHRKLLESMKKYGFLVSFPIVIVRDKDGKMIVKDGQHRLMIAEQLGLPIHYVEETVDFDVAIVNSTAKVWVLGDYARKHAANGHKAYQEGLDFAELHGLTIGTAFGLLAGTTTWTNCQTAFYEGSFKVKDRQWADDVAGVYSPLVRLSAHVKNARFMEACMAICRVDGFDSMRLISNAERCREKLVSYSTRDAYLEMLEAIYNYGRKQLVGLKSASIMAMRERNACKGKGKTTNSVQATA